MSLPGVNTQIKDRFIALSRTNIPLGPRVGIIGKRTTGEGTGGIANLDPYNAINETDVITAFGAGSQLHRGYLEALAGGATRVSLVALPADTIFNHTNGTLSSVSYGAAPGSETLLTNAFAAVESASVDIVVPWGRGSGPTEFDDQATPATPGNTAEVGFHADNSADPNNSWAVKVATHCATITANSYPIFAVMGVKPFVGNPADAFGGMTPAQVATHMNFTALVSRATPALASVGRHLSIVAAEVTPVGYNKNYTFGFSNGAVMYAGYICGLDSWSAPTGKVVFNVEKMRYNPTRVQQQNLIDKAIVPVALNFSKIPVWVDAQTFSPLGSDFTRLTTLRITFDAVQMIRQVAQQFIGEASNAQTRNALDTAITSGLRNMQVAGAVLDSDFAIQYDPVNYKAIVNLVLRPAFELRNIEVNVSIDL